MVVPPNMFKLADVLARPFLRRLSQDCFFSVSCLAMPEDASILPEETSEDSCGVDMESAEEDSWISFSAGTSLVFFLKKLNMGKK